MAKKYYAVAKGKTPGIYLTWDDCKAQVTHFSGAVYKSFTTLQEAEDFITNVTKNSSENVLPGRVDDGKQENMADDLQKEMQLLTPVDEAAVSTEEHLIAYVDGSYDHRQRRYAYGCALVLSEDVVTLNGSDNHPDYVTMRNVAGEIIGSEQAVLWAIEHDYKAVTIYYDYEGIEKWADGIWKANKPGTQRYKEFVAEKRNEIKITFQKVAAHTGVKYNEMADRLAKEALGLV